MVPFSFSLKRDSELSHLTGNMVQISDTDDPQEDLSAISNQHLNSNHRMIIYPILFSWLALLIYTMSKSIIRFSYPVFLKDFGEPSYYTYLNQLAVQIGQLTGLTLINYIKVYSRKFLVFLSIVYIIFVSITIIFVQNILYISIVSSSIGIFIGFIQGTAVKIMIDYGAEHNTKKYSTINEVLKGIGFGLTPIVAGIIAETNNYANFVVFLTFGIVTLIILIFISRKIKNKDLHFKIS